MKRFLLSALVLLSAFATKAQFDEDFTPTPTGWVLSSGASFGTIGTNNVILTPGVGGSNPAVIGTPAVSKTSNTVKVCLDITAYTSNLNSQVPFPCATFMDVLFVNSAVTTANDAQMPANIYARVDNYQLPTNGGNTCFTFTFPASVTAPNFKVFLSFHAGCTQGGIRYVIDNVQISGVDDICAGASCPPSALNDVFNRANPSELSFNAVLYGSNINYPAPPPGYDADGTGTDNDQNDTYDHLRWELVGTPTGGTVTVNPDGTCTITRASLTTTQVTFTYRLCDDGADDNFATTADNLCDDATVIANFTAGATTPVSLINYTGTRNGSMVTLKWTTTFEGNNKGFHVQKSSDGLSYQSVGFVNTKAVNGNSGVNLQYTFGEMNAAAGLTWYRLVQEDQDGTMKVYPAKAVRGLEESAKITLLPNPTTTGNLSVVFGNNHRKNIVLSDMSGKLLKKWSNYAEGNLSITSLNTGMYMLIIIDSETNERSVNKVIVSR